MLYLLDQCSSSIANRGEPLYFSCVGRLVFLVKRASLLSSCHNSALQCHFNFGLVSYPSPLSQLLSCKWTIKIGGPWYSWYRLYGSSMSSYHPTIWWTILSLEVRPSLSPLIPGTPRLLKFCSRDTDLPPLLPNSPFLVHVPRIMDHMRSLDSNVADVCR